MKPAGTPAGTSRRVPPTGEQLRIAAAVLDELARAHRTAWSNPATRVALAAVATWLARVATPSPRESAPVRCECGAALAHVAGAGVSATLCPACDRDALAEQIELAASEGESASGGQTRHRGQPALFDLTAQLAELGREAARDAWVEHAGELEQIPRSPELRAWSKHAAALGLLEADRPLSEPERRVFVHAYRNELHALAAAGAP